MILISFSPFLLTPCRQLRRTVLACGCLVLWGVCTAPEKVAAWTAGAESVLPENSLVWSTAFLVSLRDLNVYVNVCPSSLL